MVNHRVHSRSAGFSSTSVIIFAFMAAAVGAGVLKMVSEMGLSVKRLQNTATRNDVFRALKDKARSPGMLFLSSQQASNGAFARCINTAGGNDCYHSAGNALGNFAAFTLYERLGGGNAKAISGNGVSYTKEGVFCNRAPDLACPMLAETMFAASCQGGVATCAQSLQMKIIVRYSESVRPATPKSGSTYVALKTQLVDPANSLIIDTREIVTQGQKTCAANEVQTGYDQFGNPICSNRVQTASFSETITGGSCGGGQVQTGMNPNGTPVCGPIPLSTLNVSCPAGQMLIGLSGGSPVCGNPPAAVAAAPAPSGPAPTAAPARACRTTSSVNLKCGDPFYPKTPCPKPQCGVARTRTLTSMMACCPKSTDTFNGVISATCTGTDHHGACYPFSYNFIILCC